MTPKSSPWTISWGRPLMALSGISHGKLSLPEMEAAFPWHRTQHSALFRGNYISDPSFNLSFVQPAIHSGSTTPLNSLSSFPPLHPILTAALNFPICVCDACGPNPAQHHVSYWLTTPVIYPELLQHITYPLFRTGCSAWILLSTKAGNSSGKW